MDELGRSDADLLAEGAGSVGALLDRHARPVFRLAFALVGNAADAQDITQDTFVLAWRKAGQIRLVGESALPWLLASARFIASDHLRTMRRRRTDSLELSDDGLVDASADAFDDGAVLGSAMQSLSAVDREIVELVLVDGLSYKEAGTRVGLSSVATGKRLQRARSRLQALIRADRNTEGV